jgi:hypothetical protein
MYFKVVVPGIETVDILDVNSYNSEIDSSKSLYNFRIVFRIFFF